MNNNNTNKTIANNKNLKIKAADRPILLSDHEIALGDYVFTFGEKIDIMYELTLISDSLDLDKMQSLINDYKMRGNVTIRARSEDDQGKTIEESLIEAIDYVTATACATGSDRTTRPVLEPVVYDMTCGLHHAIADFPNTTDTEVIFDNFVAYNDPNFFALLDFDTMLAVFRYFFERYYPLIGHSA